MNRIGFVGLEIARPDLLEVFPSFSLSARLVNGDEKRRPFYLL